MRSGPDFEYVWMVGDEFDFEGFVRSGVNEIT